jgi:hypothetical protein
MPKLKKRLPESRSEKRERLASEKDRKAAERALFRVRREKCGLVLRILQDWRIAVERRLDSDEAYARFEAIHLRDWDIIRPIWLPDVTCSLEYQHLLDGKPTDPEPLLEYLSKDPPNSQKLLRQFKKLVLTPTQTEQLHTIALEALAKPYWHARTREYIALLRRFMTPELYEKSVNLSKENQDLLCWHLNQEELMRNQKL